MGMVPFLLIAAAEKRRRDAASASARRRLAEEAARKKNSSSSSSYSYSRKDSSYIDCLIKELAYDNPELFEFFKKFDRAIDSAIEEKCAESTKGIADCLELAKKYVDKMKALREKMKEAGLTDYELKFDDKVSFYDPESDIVLDHVPTRISYLDARITKEMAENPKDRTFEDAHERMQEEVAAAREKEQQVKADLEIKRRKLSHAVRPSSKESLKKSIAEDERKLESYRKIRKNADIAEKRRDFFANLTPEQRQLLADYCEAGEQASSLAHLIYEHSTRREKTRRYSRGDREIIVRAFEILGEKEHLSQEDIAKIFDQLDRVAIKRHRNEYDMHSWSSDKDGPVERYKSTLEGFVKHIYEADPKFVERNAWEVSDSDLDEPEY